MSETLSALTNQQLAEKFAAISAQQGEAVRVEDTKKYNKLFDALQRVVNELRARGTDARKVLIPLLDAPTPEANWNYQTSQTRFNAAVELKALAPERAQATLEALASKGLRQFRGMAGMSLYYDEMGISKPT